MTPEEFRQHGRDVIDWIADYMEQGEEFQDVEIVERLNGGSRSGENERAWDLCESKSYRGIGGSDAHLPSHIGACLTSFPGKISSEGELVEALLSGEFHPVWLEDTKV